ncbi:MAG: VOC family protein [Candidatus Micrarchaeota archaeon]
MKKMNPVVHFELPAEDKERMKKFYAKTFGWEMNQMGPDMGNYVVVMTSESDDNGPKKPGMINGGFYEKTKDMGEMHPSFVIAVDDLKEHIRMVEKAGGKILDKPMDIPGVGTFVSFVDTEGNRLSMLQPLPMEMQRKK